MQPLVLKYANADGYTDFVTGIVPDYIVEDQLLGDEPFVSLSDHVLAKALEDITGIAPARKKSSPNEIDFIQLPVPRKRIPELEIELPHKAGKTLIY